MTATASLGLHIPPAAANPSSEDGNTHGDGGYTLIEMLIAIVLMGMVVTVVLSAMQMSVRATVTDREQAIAFSILQAASDEIFVGPHESCLTGNAASVYNSQAQQASIPEAWEVSPGVASPGVSIDVLNVEYLGRVDVDADFEWGAFCFEGPGYGDSPLYTQRVTIQVTFPNGVTTQTLEMVKSKQ